MHSEGGERAEPVREQSQPEHSYPTPGAFHSQPGSDSFSSLSLGVYTPGGADISVTKLNLVKL